MAGVAFTDIYPDGPGSVAAGGPGGAPGATNQQYPGMPVGATPVERDLVITTATTTVIWDPGTNQRFVLASAFISTDTAMKISLIDDVDVQGQRPVAGHFAANGGASPNLVPVPYPAKALGNKLRVVTAGAGNVVVRVSGWQVPG